MAADKGVGRGDGTRHGYTRAHRTVRGHVRAASRREGGGFLGADGHRDSPGGVSSLFIIFIASSIEKLYSVRIRSAVRGSNDKIGDSFYMSSVCSRSLAVYINHVHPPYLVYIYCTNTDGSYAVAVTKTPFARALQSLLSVPFNASIFGSFSSVARYSAWFSTSVNYIQDSFNPCLQANGDI